MPDVCIMTDQEISIHCKYCSLEIDGNAVIHDGEFYHDSCLYIMGWETVIEFWEPGEVEELDFHIVYPQSFIAPTNNLVFGPPPWYVKQ